jgi:pimeloyl-ACP methyl ester carboxylesterase
MHYVAAGQGAGLVLLHGWPGFWFDYRHVLAPAAALGRVVAPDLFGFGESSALRGDPVDAADEDAFAEDVRELIESLDLSTVVLVGHDIGSAVAPAVARRAPELVRGLVLLNPTHPHIGDKRYTPGAQREAWYQHFHLLPLAERLLDGDRRSIRLYLAHFYEHWAGHTPIEPEELELVVDVYSRPGAFTSSIAWYRARAARRGRPHAPAAVEIPTIALWGDRDPMRPLEHREGFEHTFPRAESRVLAGVGHFVPAEAPADVVDAIAALL